MSESRENAFVTLATFQDLASAQFHQDVLAQNGIESFLPDENTAALLFPPMIYAMGGVRLDVAEADFERAKQILDSAMENSGVAEEEQEAGEPEGDYDDTGVVDETADEEYVEGEGESAESNLSGLRYLLGIVLLFIFGVTAYYTVNFLAVLIAK